MDDRTKVLQLLAEGPEDAYELGRKLGMSRNLLFSLLMRMEKEDSIVWNGRNWAVKPPSDSKQSGPPDTSHAFQGGPDA